MAQAKTASASAQRKVATKPAGQRSTTRASARTTTTKTARPSTRRAPVQATVKPAPHAVTMRLPLVTVQVRAPHVPRVHAGAMAHAITHPSLPPAERMAYYAGLGALAAFGVIEWPVAAAIGAGTVLARRAIKQSPGAKQAAGAGTSISASGHQAAKTA